MTNYEKFLKGDILPFKKQMIKRLPHEKAKFCYIFRISVYKKKYYILIMKHKIKAAAYRADYMGSTGHKGSTSFYNGYQYVQPDECIPVLEMINYLVLKKNSLKTLNDFLYYPVYYLNIVIKKINQKK